MDYYGKYFNKEYIDNTFSTKIRNTKTKGLDRISAFVFDSLQGEQIPVVLEKCNKKEFSFTPYLEVLISRKKNKTPRVISIATVRDRLVLYALKNVLHEYFPERVNRKLPNNIIKGIRDIEIEGSGAGLNYIKSDITNFFPSINQTILFEILENRIKDKRVINLLKKAIKNPTVPHFYKRINKHKYVSHKGIPQGLSISSILASIYLTEIDKELASKDFTFYRYVDDILIFTYDEYPETLFEDLSKLFLKYDLELQQDEKTLINPIEFPFDFLGYQFDFSKKIKNKPTTSVRYSSQKSFIQKIANLFYELKTTSKFPEKLPKWLKGNKELLKQQFINRLNERITGIISENKRYGWIFYFNEINDENLLYRLDSILNNFFRRSEVFENKKPDGIKSFVKAYFEIKHNLRNSSYIQNYDSFSTKELIEFFLKENGIIDPEREDYKYIELRNIFEKEKRKRLAVNQLDIGRIS